MPLLPAIAAVLLIVLGVARAGRNSDDPESLVHTPLGSVQGITTPYTREFRSIPYAEDPPRWQRARAVKTFGRDVLLARDQPPACPQLTNHCTNTSLIPCPSTMSESCLRMNIFTPRLTAAESKKAVYVFLHGGEPAYM